MKKIIFWIVCAVVVIGGLVWLFMPKPVEVETALVTKGEFERVIEEDGKTRLRERYVVSAPLAGRVSRIALREGDSVRKGDVVAMLSPSAPGLIDARTEDELRARVGAVEANIGRAKASIDRAAAALDQANNDLKRTETLANRGFVSATQYETTRLNARLRERELESAKQDAHAVEHDLEQARAALKAYSRPIGAERGRSWEVKAPIDGKVLKVVQRSEDVLTAGTPLIELGDPTKLEVVVDVLTSDAASIVSGMPAQVGFGNGAKAIEGRVRLVEPAAFTKVSALGVEEQRVNVVVDFLSELQPSAPKQEAFVPSGDAFRVDVRIRLQKIENAVKIPISAVFPAGERSGVYVLEEGRARLRSIDIGSRGASEAVVVKGIEPETVVVVYPPSSLKDGARVIARSRDKRV